MQSCVKMLPSCEGGGGCWSVHSQTSFWLQWSSAWAMPGRDRVFWIILFSLALVSLPSGFAFPPRVRYDVKDPTRFITWARLHTRVCLDTDVLGSDFRDHLQRRFTVCILMCWNILFAWAKKSVFASFPTFWGLKSYFTQCWNPFPFDFNEVTIKQPPTKWAE